MKSEPCSDPPILIGICSCRQYANKRQAIRETWLKRLPLSIKAMFFVGEGTEGVERDVICLSTRDDRDALPRKVQAFFQYALKFCDFDYLFKCDDDTYVVCDRLNDLLVNPQHFMGSTEWWPSHADGGAGYLLSRKATEIAANAVCPETGPEDVWVTQSLRSCGINFSPSSQLRQDCKKFPEKTNNIITAHWCTPDCLRQIHNGIMHPEPGEVSAANKKV